MQRRVLHIFCYHDLSLCSLYKILSNIIFHSSLLAPFVDSCYSPRGPHRFYYRNFTGFWAEFGYGKYLSNRTFLVRFGGISGLFGSRYGYFGSTASRKIRTMARPNSPDMPTKRTKKVRLGINIKLTRL